jgi:ribosomal protein L40E
LPVVSTSKLIFRARGLLSKSTPFDICSYEKLKFWEEKMKKRVLSLLLVLLMVVSLVPISALADKSNTDVAYAVERGNIYFNKATGTITDCDESVTKAIIPAEIDGVAVTSIDRYAFSGCTRLKSVTIPNSVTSIGYNAFGGCTSLASINIPNSVTSIGDSVFYGCTSLASIDIPNSVTSINHYAFSGCKSLASIDIPNSVTIIDNYAFQGCTSLVSINIPNSVTRIGDVAFSGCTSLTSVDIKSCIYIGKNVFKSCTSLKNVTLPANLKSIGNSTFNGCTSLENIDIKSCNYIEDYVFQGCTSLKNVTLSANLSSIGDFSFEGCTSLETINVNKVSSIGNSAFSGCTALTTVYLPTSVKTIGNGAFRYCTSLADVYYAGDAAQWNAIKIEPYNEPLTGATIHYGGTAHTHSYTAAVTAPTCTEQGYTTYTCSCGDSYKSDYKDALGHDYKNGLCTRCGAKDPGVTPPHTHDYKAAVTAPTCTQAGYTTYTCSCGDSYKSDYKDALGHDYQNGTCTRCGAKDPGVTPPHTHDYKATVTAPTCTQAGYTTYTCSCGDSYKSDYKDALGHDYKNGTCTRCGAKDPGATPPHTHDYKSVVTKPTCTEQGYTTYTCSICGDSYKGDYKDARGHLFVLGKCLRCGEQDPDSHTHEYTKTVVAPTCTTRGYTEHVCSCGSSYKTDYTAALGHDYKNGLCTRCGAKDPSAHTHDYKATVTKPTCTERGYTTYTCSVCGDSYKGSYVDPLGHDYKNGTCTRCGVKDPNYKPQADFTDVAAGSYCYDAVQWAVANGITKGTDKTHFSPNAGCTRGQVVTFLWRAAGEPVVSGNVGFVDVAPGSYCYEAVKWAVANGITKGTDATHFSPNATCTRGQVVTFMYRAEGEPAVGGSNGFVDVAPGSYCYEAVKWAVANGITKGTDATHFSPNATCTRGQVVTFLYRAQ